MPDTEKLKRMYEETKRFKGDKTLLNNLMQNGGEDLLEKLEVTGLKIIDDLIAKKNDFEVKHTNPTNTVPTTSIERLEESVKAKSPTALNTVMQAEHCLGGNNDAKIFDNIGFRLRDAHELQLRKKTKENKTTTLYVDPLFDNAIGTSFEKRYNSTSKIYYYGEYDFKDNEGNFGLRYTDKSCSLGTNIFVGENYGVNFSGHKHIDKYSKIKGSTSVFDDGAAFKIEYEKFGKNNTYISAGVYGSTEKKEIGIIGRIAF